MLSAGHARALLGLDDAAGQERLAQRIVAEGLSVRSVEEIVALGGDAPERVRTQRGARPVAPKLGVLAERLSDRFETRVKVDLGRSKGRIVVEFALDRRPRADRATDGAGHRGAGGRRLGGLRPVGPEPGRGGLL